MGYKKDCRKKKQRTLQQLAFAEKKKYDKQMQGKKTKLVPHPTLPKTFIEKIIEDDATIL